MENFIKQQIQLTPQAEDYLRRNASKLLNGPTDYTLDVLKKLLGYEDDYEFDAMEIQSLGNLLFYLSGETKHGITEVFSNKEKPTSRFEQIRGFIGNIRDFRDIPMEERCLRYKKPNGENIELYPLMDFILDGELILVAYYPQENCISYFTVEFNEDNKSILNAVQDDEQFNLIDTIWGVLKEA